MIAALQLFHSMASVKAIRQSFAVKADGIVPPASRRISNSTSLSRCDKRRAFRTQLPPSASKAAKKSAAKRSPPGCVRISVRPSVGRPCARACPRPERSQSPERILPDCAATTATVGHRAIGSRAGWPQTGCRRPLHRRDPRAVRESPSRAARSNRQAPTCSHSMPAKNSASERNSGDSTDWPKAINGRPRLTFKFIIRRRDSNQKRCSLADRRTISITRGLVSSRECRDARAGMKQLRVGIARRRHRLAQPNNAARAAFPASSVPSCVSSPKRACAIQRSHSQQEGRIALGKLGRKEKAVRSKCSSRGLSSVRRSRSRPVRRAR